MSPEPGHMHPNVSKETNSEMTTEANNISLLF